MDKLKNPILYYIGGIPIRKKNQLSISVGEAEMIRLVEASIDTGLSIPKIIALQGQPCQNCGKDNIAIPKGILNIKKNLQGGSIIKRTKENKDDLTS